MGVHAIILKRINNDNSGVVWRIVKPAFSICIWKDY